jgi:hypothetical protein
MPGRLLLFLARRIFEVMADDAQALRARSAQLSLEERVFQSLRDPSIR